MFRFHASKTLDTFSKSLRTGILKWDTPVRQAQAKSDLRKELKLDSETFENWR